MRCDAMMPSVLCSRSVCLQGSQSGNLEVSKVNHTSCLSRLTSETERLNYKVTKDLIGKINSLEYFPPCRVMINILVITLG